MFLGMNLDEDREFLYIAEEGLKAAVPEPWEVFYDSKKDMYFYNRVTKETTYEHPLDQAYREKFLKLKKEKQEREKNGLSSQPSQARKSNPIGAVSFLSYFYNSL